MSLFTISSLKKAARQSSPVEASVHAQIEKITSKEASNGKPFREIQLRDETDSMTLRAWSDTEAFEACASLGAGSFVSVEGVFSHSTAFGLDSRRWEIARLEDEAIEALLLGSPERRSLLDRCAKVIEHAIAGILGSRLKALCERFPGTIRSAVPPICGRPR